jgi:hypothetical protein
MKYDFDDAMIDPEEVFAHPEEVLKSSFDEEQKRKILLSWQDQLDKRQIATSEGMSKDPGSDPISDNLQAVAVALTKLESQ